jgi:phosphoglucosamine mutase
LALGKAAGHVLAAQSPRPRVLIGRDTRASGEMLEAALAAGICSAGADAVTAGVATTPAIATLTRLQGFSAGAVISASHNPARENGIKFLGADGAKLPDATEAAIEELVKALRAGGRTDLAAESVGRYYEDEGSSETYAFAARASVAADVSGFRLVVDAANGAGYRLNGDILESMGVRITRIHCGPDGLNINKACGSTHPDSMCETVVSAGADLGAAFDGDGDRVILSDEKGGIVDGDRVMAICAHNWRDTDELPGNMVVGTVMSNLGLEKCLGAIGVELLRAGVGDRYVAQLMRESGAAVGGEKSGHMIFLRHATTGDGLITLLQIMGIMASTGKRLSELAAVMEEYPQILIGVRVRRKEGWDAHSDVLAAMAAAESALSGRGRLLVRPSGTENIIRIMAEGPDGGELDRLANDIAEAVRRHAED